MRYSKRRIKTMKVLKKVLLALLIVLVAIQFIRPARNASTAEQKGDIIKQFSIQADVQKCIENILLRLSQQQYKLPLLR